MIEGARLFITGANRGLGRAFVRQALELGAARVYAAARDPASLDATLALDAARVRRVRLDVTSVADCAAAARDCGDVDVVINNAGVLSNYGGFVTKPDQAGIRHEMDVNYYGVLNVCQAFAPVLAANGGGGIINVLSILAIAATPVVGSYCAAKFAALALTRCLAAELAAQRTRVLAAIPATIDTDMANGYPGPKDAPDFVARTALEALAAGQAEVHIGPLSNAVHAQFRNDPEGLARERAQMLPT
ncbi:MAG: SDR family NAD(P)-dependent oxidoreductase [Gammaproteobacteria bacterium]|nr:SDR family NAD(P)-dependent oxidoreductase [Gammaproteobacteria bacterium]